MQLEVTSFTVKITGKTQYKTYYQNTKRKHFKVIDRHKMGALL